MRGTMEGEDRDEQKEGKAFDYPCILIKFREIAMIFMI